MDGIEHIMHITRFREVLMELRARSIAHAIAIAIVTATPHNAL